MRIARPIIADIYSNMPGLLQLHRSAMQSADILPDTLPLKVVLDRDATPRADLSAVAPGAPLVRVCAWNVGGLRALLKSDERRALLQRLLSEEQPDVLCLQVRMRTLASSGAFAPG